MSWSSSMTRAWKFVGRTTTSPAVPDGMAVVSFCSKPRRSVLNTVNETLGWVFVNSAPACL
jgi:hypothetical protein